MSKPTFNLSVGEFALPSPLRGSIESLSGFQDGALVGQEIHQRVQRSRLKDHPDYQAEVAITHEFETAKYIFRVGGRIDGLFSSEPVGGAASLERIEEIKTTFSVDELVRRLKHAPDEHPYCLQLKTYGYMHWLQHQRLPKLSFHLVSTRNFKAQDWPLKFDVDVYEAWLERRLAELSDEADRAGERLARRKRLAKELSFPFNPMRRGQKELIETIEEGLHEKRRMLLQAPTGLGKTVGVLYPVLKEALNRGQRSIYLTPKNSQHAVAEEAMEQFQKAGAKVKSLTITAKSKICQKNEPLCNPEYCEYAKDHYTKFAEHGLQKILAKKRKLTARTFKKLSDEYQVCPFELQLEAAREVDTVICDYNYAFAPRSAFGRLAANDMQQAGKPNLVIDEAHNVPSRAMDYHSPELSSWLLAMIGEDIANLPKRFQGEFGVLLERALEIVASCEPRDENTDAPLGKAAKIDPPLDMFAAHDADLRDFLSRYLESDVEIQRRDPVLRLVFYWSDFTSALEFVQESVREEYFVSFQPGRRGGVVKITCCDASALLESCYDNYEHVVGFSATLKPFDFYSQLSGLASPELKQAEFPSPFDRERRKLIIVPQVSSKYSERERNSPRIAEAIERITALKRGNYLAFFPSFEFMERVLKNFNPPPGFSVIVQERSMAKNQIDEILEALRKPGSRYIVFGVQGGVFAEGVDYPGEMVIGAFVVGAPLPNFNLEREEMRAYYQKRYGAGFDYAYTYPAMAKAVQAAGRVIRSETDRGLIVLMDDRFVDPQYVKSMPVDWFTDHVRELVSQSLIKDIEAFWSEGANEDQKDGKNDSSAGQLALTT